MNPTASTLTLHVNGDARVVRAPMTVAELLAELGVEPRQVAVERNRVIVRRDDHATTQLADGDRLEVVTFVGGG